MTTGCLRRSAGGQVKPSTMRNLGFVCCIRMHQRLGPKHLHELIRFHQFHLNLKLQVRKAAVELATRASHCSHPFSRKNIIDCAPTTMQHGCVVCGYPFAWLEKRGRKAKQGSLHYTPEHCLVNGGVPLFWWKKTCFKRAKCIF